MITAIILVIIIAVLVSCIRWLARRLAGRSSCCDVQAPRAKPKKLPQVSGSFTLEIEGMRCESCRRTVAAAINALDGYAARVSLEHGTAAVSYALPSQRDPAAVIAAVEAAGYGAAVRDTRRKPSV